MSLSRDAQTARRRRVRRRRDGANAELAGRCRVDRRTKNLLRRLERGEIAVIHHADLDRVAADGLIAAGAAAVVNAVPTMSGRYPALGGLTLAQAGVPVLEEIGEAAFKALGEGDEIAVAGDEVVRDGEVIGTGYRRDAEYFEHVLESARIAVRSELGSFARNTLEYLEQEPQILTEELDIPPLRHELRGRHVLVVVRGIDYREDLAALRRSGYVSDMRPVLIGVDGGADALLEAGLVPHIIIGDFDSVSPRALDCGAQLIVHGYPEGGVPGARHLDDAGLSYDVIAAPGTSEDLALRLAFEQRAEQIVEVGSHTSMVDFFDKGRRGMASTFLTRMQVSSALVDAKGVSRLYRTQVRKRDMAMLIVSALVTIGVIAAVTEPGRLLLRTLWINMGL
ncbi:putative cytokinetic ring protein SteA [Candidatus Poriferisodalis sp.]|uniref:putative cytokinetic ring protein SteA n=1 Tax=Candidatus Poriferisodalis sp. TaxID=3101277 RepID=UPI003C6F102B